MKKIFIISAALFYALVCDAQVSENFSDGDLTNSIAVDLLTTNETYFFREPKHFDFLRSQALPELKGQSTVRVWSGACSSGEEPYTIAMMMAEVLGGRPWEIVASDLSTRVLTHAREGRYPMDDAAGIPRPLLVKYCLKGVGSQDGTFMTKPELRGRINFRQINLNETLPALGLFDVIFLRNVMIYFDIDTKRQVVQRILPLLKPGGYFIVSHSENLNGVTSGSALHRSPMPGNCSQWNQCKWVYGAG